MNMIPTIKNFSAAVFLSDSKSDLVAINRLLIPTILFAFAIVWFRFGFDVKTATACMWGVACLASGAAVGFLFGIPRYSPEAGNLSKVPGTLMNPNDQAARSEVSGHWQSNSNLVEISDWLTKIIIGLGLIHLKDIPGEIWRMAGDVAKGLDVVHSAPYESFVFALLVAFSVIGFVTGYLYTRIYLQGALKRAEDGFRHVLDEQTTEAKNQATITQSASSGVPPALPTSMEIEQAENLERLASPKDVSVSVVKMQELAREYERVRAVMPSGVDRTREMTKVVAQMKRIALTVLPALSAFSRSDSSGERLAAIAVLQIRFDPDYIDWLAECLVKEVPFLGFHSSGGQNSRRTSKRQTAFSASASAGCADKSSVSRR
jgi:hypothetical protein